MEATTGTNALAIINNQLQELQEVARQLRVQPGNGLVETAVNNLLDEKKSLEKELMRLKSRLASSQGDDLAGQAIELNGAKVMAAKKWTVRMRNTLRETMDKLKDKLKSAAIVLGAGGSDKVTSIAASRPISLQR